jgi:hypothetical protein
MPRNPDYSKVHHLQFIIGLILQKISTIEKIHKLSGPFLFASLFPSGFPEKGALPLEMADGPLCLA